MQISDIVDLIIDKKASILNESLSPLVNEQKKLRDEYGEDNRHNTVWNNTALMMEIKSYIEEKYIPREYINSSDQKFNMSSYENMMSFDMIAFFYMPKSNLEIKEKYQDLSKKIADIKNQISDIKNSRDEITAKVTLLKLSEIDVDFSNKVEELSNRIFNQNLIS